MDTGPCIIWFICFIWEWWNYPFCELLSCLQQHYFPCFFSFHSLGVFLSLLVFWGSAFNSPLGPHILMSDLIYFYDFCYNQHAESFHVSIFNSDFSPKFQSHISNVLLHPPSYRIPKAPRIQYIHNRRYHTVF